MPTGFAAAGSGFDAHAQAIPPEQRGRGVAPKVLISLPPMLLLPLGVANDIDHPATETEAPQPEEVAAGVSGFNQS